MSLYLASIGSLCSNNETVAPIHVAIFILTRATKISIRCDLFLPHNYIIFLATDSDGPQINTTESLKGNKIANNYCD